MNLSPRNPLAPEATARQDLLGTDTEPAGAGFPGKDRPLRTTAGRWLAIAEPLLAAGTVPVLLFPRGPLPWVALGILLLLWVLRRLVIGGWLLSTPLNTPIAVLLIMTFVSLCPSIDLSLSLPRFFGIVLCFAVYFVTVRAIRSEIHFWVGVGILVAAVVGVAVLGLTGTQWNGGKFTNLEPIYETIPRLIHGEQSSTGWRGGFHPNMIGGTLAFLLPLPLALLTVTFRRRWLRPSLSAICFLGLATLVLTESRSGLAGFGAGLLALLIWRWRKIGLRLVAVATLSAFVLATANHVTPTTLLESMDSISSTNTGSLPSRLEVWDRARYMVEDFTFTGIGLNTFPIVLDSLYPSFIADPDVRIDHAHDVYLQTAVDLGAAGLAAFLALWVQVSMVVFRNHEAVGQVICPQHVSETQDRQPSAIQAAIAGIAAGFVAYLVFGLTDSLAIGTRPTVFVWLMLGLVVAAPGTNDSSQKALNAVRSWRDKVSNAGIGLAASTGSTYRASDAVQPQGNRHQPARHSLRPSSRCSQCSVLLPTLSVICTLASFLWRTYWMITYLLVVMALLVIAVRASGWSP